MEPIETGWYCPRCGAGDYWREYDQDQDGFWCGFCGWNKPDRVTKPIPKEILEREDAHEDHID